jgi:MoaA/NifB/PqqE/SkfB family radical SAM enzyme
MTYTFNPTVHKIRNLDIHINHYCNLNCRMCEINKYRKNKKNNIPEKYILNLLTQFKNYNSEGVVKFDTGEIFANKNIYTFLNHCNNIKLKIGIVTNGTLITEDDIEKLKENLGYLVIPLESHLEDIHDYMRGKGTFNKVIRLITLLNRKKVHYSVNTVVSKLNLDHILKLYEYLNRNEYFYSHNLNILKNSFFSNEKEIRFFKQHSFRNDKDLSEVNKKMIQYMNHTKGLKTSYIPEVHKYEMKSLHLWNKETLEEPLCNIFKRNMFIDFSGNVRLCSSTVFPHIGNITDDDFDIKNIWESEKAQNLREKMEKCVQKCGLLTCTNKEISFNKLEYEYTK